MTWRFEFYGSLQFWGAVVVVALLVRAAGPRLRRAVIFVSSLALLFALPRFGVADFLAVCGVAAVSLLAARALVRPETKHRRLIATLGVAAVVADLVFFKYHFVQRVLTRADSYIFVIGVSYFSFKAIHVIVEAYKRTVPSVSPLDYLDYIFYFPSFISGPICRFPHFVAELRRETTLRGEAAPAAERIVHGLFKKFVLAHAVHPWSLGALGAAPSEPSRLALALYCSALYFYFDFAGYSDLAIGAGRLVGVTPPENFDRPFAQKNIRDLWNHWHMSLTSWLVDYVYWPLARGLRGFDLFRQSPLLVSTVAMTVTFVLCGMWHGDGFNFVLWGAYHGIGISIATLYQRYKRAIPSARLQRWFRSRASAVVGAVGTFHFFAAGLALFLLDTQKLRALFAALFG